MKKKSFFVMILLIGVWALKMEAAGDKNSLPKPKLVVGIKCALIIYLVITTAMGKVASVGCGLMELYVKII